MTSAVFNLREHLTATGALSELQRAARGAGLRLTSAGVSILCLVGMLTLDWEIYYRIFEYMTDGENFWTPHLMACTPAIMLVGFHVLASTSPNHPIIRILGALSGLFIAAFVLGGGLYIAAMLFGDTGAPGQAPLAMPPLGGLPAGDAAKDQSWLDALFSNITSPVGTLALCLGIGGLSVVSVVAGHHLIVAIEHNVREVWLARRNLREGQTHYRASQDAERQFAEFAAEHERLMRCSDDQLLVQIAGLVLQTINTHAIPHEKRLQQMRFSQPDTLLDRDHSAEIKRVEAALKLIRAISLKDVLNALSSFDNTRNFK